MFNTPSTCSFTTDHYILSSEITLSCGRIESLKVRQRIKCAVIKCTYEKELLLEIIEVNNIIMNCVSFQLML